MGIEITNVMRKTCLNEVRSWRPEQLDLPRLWRHPHRDVSMKSGLRDRNNMTVP